MYEERFAISSHDVDPLGALRPDALLRLMQETANHQMRDERPSYMELFEAGKAFLLSRMAVEVYAPLHQYEQVCSATWPAGGRGAAHYRCSRIARGDEIELVCEGPDEEKALKEITEAIESGLGEPRKTS